MPRDGATIFGDLEPFSGSGGQSGNRCPGAILLAATNR